MLPYSCNAPIYHWPIATVSVIATNVLVFFGAVAGKINLENGWVLEYGQGLHAQQWILSIFAHAGPMHLVSNMFFLWVFGLVTEGKIGWLKFLSCYLFIGVGQSAVEQFIFSGSEYAGEGSLGASAAVFGLMGMACVWAPANEVTMFTWIFMRVYTFEVSIGILSACYVGIELTLWIVLGHAAGSALLHLMGAFMGFAIGAAMLRTKQVDCEHWDLFSLFQGNYGPYAKKEASTLSEKELEERKKSHALDAKRKFLACLQTKQAIRALEVRQRMIDLGHPLEVDRRELLALIAGLHQEKKWKASVPVMAEFLKRFPEGSEPVRLKLAQICLVEMERPAKAVELLEELSSGKLSEEQTKFRQKLLAVARRQVQEGVLEVDDETV